MSETKTTRSRTARAGRMFWIVGLAVGIVAGGTVAVIIASSAARPMIGGG